MRTFLGGALTVGWLLTGPSLPAAERVDYLRQVKPLLAFRCFACHGALQQKSGLRVDTAAALKDGGDGGPAVVPGNSAASRLLHALTGTQGVRRMPPPSDGEALHDNEVALIRQWIDQGANAPADEKPEADPRAHWSFRAPVRPAVPPVKNTAWVRNPVDAFLAAAHEQHGLTPQPTADRRTLLRRVYLDLVGLPPTSAELEAALRDESPDWYEKVVDRLLTSPRHGERWGRHWMDIWRYSDPWGLGAEIRNSQKHIWRWRDWIIESVRTDKGYDQMLREMLAADELYPNDLDRLRATGFLVRNYFKFNRNTWLDETVEHTAKAFLGLTMNCAKCHDHKFDPITQKDYYRMRAFFEPYQVRIDQVPGETDPEKDGLARVFDCNLDMPTYLFVRGDEKNPAKDRPMAAGVPNLLALGKLEIRPLTLPPEAYSPGLRAYVLENFLSAAEHRIAAARVAVEKASKDRAALPADAMPLDAGPPAPGPATKAQVALVLAEKLLAAAEVRPIALRARAAADRAHIDENAVDYQTKARAAALAERRAAALEAEAGVARAEQEVVRADAAHKAEADKKAAAARVALEQARQALASPGETYAPLRGSIKTLESNVETEASRSRAFPTTSTGRRTALAQWMTDPRHPLTARVAANHIWARHFGRPLAPTVFDLGRKGGAPTHRELLDFLACELRDHQWSMKHLHRLLVTSNAYRMSSSAASDQSPNPRSIDPENRYYWRMNGVRMEAEVVRDSLLYLAGNLDPVMGGPPVELAHAETSRRRSLYLVHSHNEHPKFLAMFDGASVLECYRRAESIVPQQALALANSKLALEAASKIAAHLDAQGANATDAQFVRAAFAMVLTAEPTAAEQDDCEQALARLTQIGRQLGRAGAVLRARANLVHALMNHNDFITIR